MKNPWVWMVAGLIAVSTGVGYFGMNLNKPVASPAPGLSSAPPEVPAPLPPNLPPLEESDALAREKALGLSSDPALQEWLKQDSLITRLSAAMNILAHGKVPRDLLAAFAPRGKFLVKKKGGSVFVDPTGYARYDKITALARSVDAVAAAKVFETLLPLFDAAQRATGEPNGSGREAFSAAARELLSAPVIAGDIPLAEGKNGIGWNYVNERLEGMSPARKQLLRMGPKNQAELQSKLRAIALALGVPDLPAVNP